MREKTAKIWIYAIVIFVATILVGLIFLTTVQLFKIKSLKKKEKQLNTKLNNLLQTESYYDNANDYVQSNEFIEKYARDVLNLGKDGEEAYNG